MGTIASLFGGQDEDRETGTISRLFGEAAPAQTVLDQPLPPGALPTEAVSPVKDVGFASGAGGLLLPTLEEALLGPYVGILEELGVAKSGRRQEVRDKYEDARDEYLAASPTATRAFVAGGMEAAANLIPLAPAAKLGSKAATAAGLTGRVAKGAVGAGVGAAEGGIVGVGSLPLSEDSGRTGRVAASVVGGALLGGAGGAALGKAVDPTNSFLKKYTRRGPKSDAPFRERAQKAVERVYTDWFDRLAPAKRVAKKVGQQEKGRELAQAVNTADSTARAPIFEATRSHDGTDRITGESYMDVFNDLTDKQYGDVKSYAVAKRNLELDARRQAGEPIEVNPQSVADAQSELARLRREYGTDLETGHIQVLKERADRFHDWENRAVIQPLYEVGVFNGDDVARIIGKNEQHVPFQRAMDELDAKGIDLGPARSGAAPIRGKKIHKGLSEKAGERIEDPFDESVEQAVRIHVFAKKQALRNFIAESADGSPTIGREVFPDDPKVIGRAFSGKGVVRGGSQTGTTFRVFRDGKQLQYKAPEDLLAALETLDFRHVPMVLRAAQGMTRFFRAGATLSPAFGVRNVGRDQLTFGVYTKHGGFPLIDPARFMVGELVHRARNKGVGSNEWREFMSSPGAHATFLSGDRFHLSREVKIARDLAKKGPAGRFFGEFRRNPLLPLQIVQDVLEKPARFAEFRLARLGGRKNVAGVGIPGTLGKGGPKATTAQAGLAGADVTLNFPQGGRIAKAWNQYEAFANAQLLDIDKFGRAMKERPVSTLTQGLAYITVPALLNWAHNKDNPDYQDLPEWEKVLFLHPMQFGEQGEGGRFVRLPLPPGLLGLMFSYLPQKSVQHMTKGDPMTSQKIKEALIQQTPLQYTPLAGSDFILDLMPNAVQPVAELTANRSPFFDQPVLSEGLERTVPEAQFRDSTTGVAKSIAGAIRETPGIPGAALQGVTLGGSPVAVDHLIRGYGATLGRGLANASGTNLAPQQKPGLSAVPGLSGLVSTSPAGFGSQPARDFRKFFEESQKAAQGHKIQVASTVQSYERLHPEWRYAKAARKISDTLGDLAESRRVISRHPNLSEDQKGEQILQIDQAVTMLTGSFMNNVADLIRRDAQILEEMRKEP